MIPLISKFTEAYIRTQSSFQRARFLGDPEVKSDFETSRSKIDELLARTTYYHGTGALNYENDGVSKYDREGSSLHKTTDSLANFIQNGLEVRHDFYKTTMGTGLKLAYL